MAITSSSVLNLITTPTGPNISSLATLISLVTSVSNVGFIKYPFLASPSMNLSPPVATLAPSCLPISIYLRIFLS
ncbi:hypothetical protein CNEONATNEC26_02315 [Clostridium neonatale]|nr:hypothetical protein CNEONATNEC26_02315 [Clostridium neonatale]